MSDFAVPDAVSLDEILSDIETAVLAYDDSFADAIFRTPDGNLAIVAQRCIGAPLAIFVLTVKEARVEVAS